MRPLERLLPAETGFAMPEVSLQDVNVATRVYGSYNPVKNSYKLLDGYKKHNVSYSRQVALPDYATSAQLNEWQHGLTIEGTGFFNHVFGYSKYADLRITVDGGDSITLTTTSSKERHALWGNWMRRNNSSQAEGMFYFSGFNETTEEYLTNFIKGSVKFEQQLRIEYRPESKTKYTDIAVDYIMESEIQWQQ